MIKEIWFGNKVGAVKNIAPRKITFEQFTTDLLTKLEVIPMTSREFHDLQKVEQSPIKDGRYFCGTSFIAPSRRDTNCGMIQLVCIDIDDEKNYKTAQQNLDALSPFNWFTYTTMSSKPGARRCRIVVDADGEMPADYYPRAVATIGDLLGIKVTTESFTLSQPMFCPKVCKDIELYHDKNVGRPFTEDDINFDLPVSGKMTQEDAQDLGDLMFLESPIDIATEEVQEALNHIDSDCSLKEWIRIAGAIKHQYQADDEEAFRVFVEWSMNGSKFQGEDDCRKTWKTLRANPDKKPATIRTVLHLAKEAGWVRESRTDDAYQEIRAQIETSSTHHQLCKEIPAQMRSTRFPVEDFEALCSMLRKKINQACDFTFPIQKLRNICKYVEEESIYEGQDGRLVNSNQETPEWCKEFYYLNLNGEFYNFKNSTHYTPSSVDFMFSRYLLTKADITDNNAKPSIRPVDYLTNVVQIGMHHSTGYHPAKDKIFKYRGKSFINTYKDTRMSMKCKDKDYEFVKKIITLHVNTLYGEENAEYGKTLLDYLSFCVQNPGFKITWAFLLQGTYGNGKSFLQRLMSMALGYQNVSSIDASVLNQEWTGFAEGSMMLFIEEMRLYDRREHAVMGRLKTITSNEDISISEKYMKLKHIPNVTNYILFTNEKGAIHINEGDRRYYISCTQQQTKQDVDEQMPDTYFEELFKVLKYPEAVRKFFMEYEIRPSFNPKGRAPATEHKKLFVENSKSELEIAIKMVLEDFEQDEVVSSTDLFHLLALDPDNSWGDLRLNNVKLRKALIKMNFIPACDGKRIKIGDKKHTLWLSPHAGPGACEDPKSYFENKGEEL